MLFEQDDMLCKQNIKSIEQHIKSSELVKNKTRMSLPGFHIIHQNIVMIYTAYMLTKWFQDLRHKNSCLSRLVLSMNSSIQTVIKRIFQILAQTIDDTEIIATVLNSLLTGVR